MHIVFTYIYVIIFIYIYLVTPKILASDTEQEYTSIYFVGSATPPSASYIHSHKVRVRVPFYEHFQ